MPRPATAALLVMALLASAGGAAADGPGPGDAAREVAPVRRPHAHPAAGAPAVGPARRVLGDSDYVGSAYGLGKPSFYGLGTRPDWGRSNVD